MKKQIRQILKFHAYLTLIILVGAICFYTQTPVQSGEQIASPKDIWEMKYEITIRGKGKIEPELGSGDAEITWVVERNFKGGGKLSVKSWKDTGANQDNLNFEGLPRGFISIMDSISKQTDPTCEEYTVEEEIWNINAEGKSSDAASSLTIINSALTYDLDYFLGYHPETTKGKGSDIGLPKEIPIPLNYKKQITRFPRNETKILSTETKGQSLFTNLPTVNEWIKSGRLLVRTKIPLVKSGDGCYCFDSGELTVNQSLLPGVDTSGKVKIQITYSLKKVVADTQSGI